MQQPSVQLPLQQVPLPHCALFVQPQVAALQVWLAVSQHCPARQSAVVQQPEVHAPLQQICPFEHWLLLVQPHAAALHECVATSQHWPARQSKSTQQVPGTQVKAAPLVAPELLEPPALVWPLELPLLELPLFELLEALEPVRLVDPPLPPPLFPPPVKVQTSARQRNPAQQSALVAQALAAEPQSGFGVAPVEGQPTKLQHSVSASPPARNGVSLKPKGTIPGARIRSIDPHPRFAGPQPALAFAVGPR